MDRIATRGIALRFDPRGGVIDDLAIDAADGTRLHPLHRAPWLAAGEDLLPSVAPIERRLAGDFFCAPFAETAPGVPIHGWAANGTWEHVGTRSGDDDAVAAEYRLRETIGGARLRKCLTLRAGHPVVYQSHVFEGGSGRLPVAHHAMLHVPGGARLSFSVKAFGATPDAALETDPARGRSILAYPQRFRDLSRVRRADGGWADASAYPFADGHEDLLVLSEAPGRALGWSAALAIREGVLFFAVKDARRLPQTVLWMSNGGRFYPPWNGRHTAVLGIEEAATGLGGHAAVADAPAGLALGAAVPTVIRYAFGAIAAPPHWTRVADILPTETSLTLRDAGGDTRVVPFHGRHFDVPGAAA